MLVLMVLTLVPYDAVFAAMEKTGAACSENLSDEEMATIVGGSKKTNFKGYVYRPSGVPGGYTNNYTPISGGCCPTTFDNRVVSACKSTSFDDFGYYYIGDAFAGGCKTNAVQASFYETQVHICGVCSPGSHYGVTYGNWGGGTHTVNVYTN